MRDQTFRNFEVIFCDRRYERRHNEVMSLASDYGINLVHAPEHRRNKEGYTSFCSGWNTAAALARGRVLIIVQDWAYCPPGFIEAHLQNHDVPGRYVIAPYLYMKVPPVKLKYDFDFTGQESRGGNCVTTDPVLDGEILDEVYPFRDGAFDPQWMAGMRPNEYPDQDTRRRPQGAGVPETYVHVKNESILRETFYNLNGLDERMERGKGPMDLELGMRMAENGVNLWWEQEALQIVPNPRPICRTMPWGSMHERLNGRWSYDDGLKYIERRRMEIAEHGDFRAKNPYDLWKLSEDLESWRTPQLIDVAPLEQTDAQYWKEQHPIWPDSK